jgi:hypothetical protein
VGFIPCHQHPTARETVPLPGLTFRLPASGLNKSLVGKNHLHSFFPLKNVAAWWFSFKHLEKYEFVNGKDDIPYIEKKMFETINQVVMVGRIPVISLISLGDFDDV